jgi:hypothetical protein
MKSNYATARLSINKPRADGLICVLMNRIPRHRYLDYWLDPQSHCSIARLCVFRSQERRLKPVSRRLTPLLSTRLRPVAMICHRLCDMCSEPILFLRKQSIEHVIAAICLCETEHLCNITIQQLHDEGDFESRNVTVSSVGFENWSLNPGG